jgi:anti-sigma regulatory factor (Ser/Thr protein kinase)
MAPSPPEAPQPPGCRLSIRPDPGEIRRSSGWLTSFCLERGVPREQIGRLELCLNEVLANLIDHGRVERLAAPVDLALNVNKIDGKGTATLTILDTCLPFDPLLHQIGATPRSLREAEPGGLGLLLLKSFSDELSYRRLDDRNELKMSVYWPARV